MFILNKDNKLPLKSLSDVIVLLNVTSFLFISNSTIDSTQYIPSIEIFILIKKEK